MLSGFSLKKCGCTRDKSNFHAIDFNFYVSLCIMCFSRLFSSAQPTIEFPVPLTSEQQRTSAEFFSALNFLLKFCPPHPSEKDLLARFAKLGIGGGRMFNASNLSPEIKKSIEDGIADAWKEFADFKRTQLDTGKQAAAEGFGTREFLANNHLGRMSSAVVGIYGNTKEEALYPAYYGDSDGNKLDASTNQYTQRFARDQLPPVNSFWTITMYDKCPIKSTD